MIGSAVFLMKLMHQFIYTNGENDFMVPSHKKKWDYYTNLCLSQLIDEIWLKNGGKWSFFYETKELIHLSQWA